jgi:DNA replication protein DnaC
VCREQAEYFARKKQREFDARFRSVRIGKRYQDLSFDDYHPSCPQAERVRDACRRYVETFSDRLAAGDGLLMLGNPGTGKNHLAACVCRGVVEAGFSALHTTALKLVRRIKETWRSGATETEQEAINSFLLPDVLVVDEIGIQFGSAAELLLLFEVLNDRYSDRRPTVLLSNLGQSELEAYLGPQIIDRFHEGKSAMLEFSWESYRRKR